MALLHRQVPMEENWWSSNSWQLITCNQPNRTVRYGTNIDDVVCAALPNW